MSRHLLFTLLLTTVVALAHTRLAAQQAAGAAAAPANTQAAHKPTEPAPARTQNAQKPAENPQATKEAAQGQTAPAQTQTEKSPEQATEAQAPAEGDAKLISVPGGKALGMSILGNQEAPKALVIVPWKSSVLGNSLGITPMLDDSRQPVDREVFLRALSYYEIRSETTRHDGAPAGGRDTAGVDRHAVQPAAAAHRRKS